MAHKHYSNVMNPAATPQTEPLPDSPQVENSAGGYSFEVEKWKQLERFLIMGTEGGTYYIGEQKLTKDNAKAALACLVEDGRRVVDMAVSVSRLGRAHKNDPALFVLALAAADKDQGVRQYALACLNDVARIGTHLFHFADFVNGMRGWGRSLRRAIRNWYTEKSAQNLAYQVVKYQARDGWSHKDLMHLCHLRPPTAYSDFAAVQHYVEKGWPDIGPDPHPEKALQLLWAFERAKKLDPTDDEHFVELLHLIRKYGLTREMVPTEALNFAATWDALLKSMPMHALVRNLGKMTNAGAIKPLSNATGFVTHQLKDEALIKHSRLHPMAVLLALKTYCDGKGFRGSLTWTPVPQVMAALSDAFYLAFQNAPVTGKRIYIGIDVSGSMSAAIANTNITAREGAAAMALILSRTEPSVHLAAFTSTDGYGHSGNTVMQHLNIHPNCSLPDVMRATDKLPFGGTDCALPMIDAMEQKLEVDAFIILTDSETWAGKIHPTEALTQYRKQSGIDAKLVCVAMVPNNFSVADPRDAGMLDVCGFDAAVPSVIADFISDGNLVKQAANNEE